MEIRILVFLAFLFCLASNTLARSLRGVNNTVMENPDPKPPRRVTPSTDNLPLCVVDNRNFPIPENDPAYDKGTILYSKTMTKSEATDAVKVVMTTMEATTLVAQEAGKASFGMPKILVDPIADKKKMTKTLVEANKANKKMKDKFMKLAGTLDIFGAAFGVATGMLGMFMGGPSELEQTLVQIRKEFGKTNAKIDELSTQMEGSFLKLKDKMNENEMESVNSDLRELNRLFGKYIRSIEEPSGDEHEKNFRLACNGGKEDVKRPVQIIDSIYAASCGDPNKYPDRCDELTLGPGGCTVESFGKGIGSSHFFDDYVERKDPMHVGAFERWAILALEDALFLQAACGSGTVCSSEVDPEHLRELNNSIAAAEEVVDVIYAAKVQCTCPGPRCRDVNINRITVAGFPNKDEPILMNTLFLRYDEAPRRGKYQEEFYDDSKWHGHMIVPRQKLPRGTPIELSYYDGTTLKDVYEPRAADKDILWRVDELDWWGPVDKEVGAICAFGGDFTAIDNKKAKSVGDDWKNCLDDYPTPANYMGWWTKNPCTSEYKTILFNRFQDRSSGTIKFEYEVSSTCPENYCEDDAPCRVGMDCVGHECICGDQGPCPSDKICKQNKCVDWTDDQCIFLENKQMSCQNHEENAQRAYGGHLVSIHSQKQAEYFHALARRQFIPKFLPYSILAAAGKSVCIGLRRTEESWVWYDSQKSAEYTNWNDGEPNNAGDREDYVEMSMKDGKWNDIPATGDKYGLYKVPCSSLKGKGSHRFHPFPQDLTEINKAIEDLKEDLP